MNTLIESESSLQEALSGIGITRKKDHRYFSIGIFSSLAALIILTVITLINPHLIWRHFITVNYTLHSAIETIGAVSAILMAFLLINSFAEKIKPSYVFISVGFLAMGIWDLFHAITPMGNGFVLTHSLALLVGGSFFFMSNFSIGETLLRHKGLVLFITAVFMSVAAASTLLFRPFLPQMIIENTFTRFADIINAVGGTLFLITAVKLFFDYHRYQELGIAILIFVSALSALAGLTFHYSHAWTDHWWFWHILRLCAHIMMLGYLLVEFSRTMKETASAIFLYGQKNDELTANQQKLEELNQQLIVNQQSLVEEKERFKSIFQNTPVGESITGLDGTMQINDTFCDMLGYTLDELKDKNWKEITHPDDIAETSSVVKSLMDGEAAYAQFEKRYIHKNGNIVWADVRTALFRDTDGNPLYFITGSADITLKKEAREKIIRQQQLTDSILDSLPGIFYQIDTNGHYKRWNRRFLQVTGRTDEEMQTINAVDFFRGEDINGVAKAMEQVFTQGEAEVEADLYTRSGEAIPYLFTGIQFEIENRPFILGMGLDISDLRSTQDRLKKTIQDLEMFNKKAVGREIRMVELKAKINRLSKELGREEPYDLKFAEQETL